MESQAMRDLLWRVCFRRKIRPHQVTGDAKYGTIENIVAVKDAEIRANIPLTDFAHRTDFYGQDDFVFDPERNEYRCPQTHPLRRYAVKRTEGVVAYRGEAAICNAGPVKTKWTTGDHGRKVQRSFYIEKVRGYHTTEPYKKAIRERQVWAEPLFAEAKEWHGLRRHRLRGLRNANIQGLFIAAGQNLKRFLSGGTAACPMWQPRGPPEKATVALGRLRLTISSTGTRLSPVYRPRHRELVAAAEGIFQRPEPFDDLALTVTRILHLSVPTTSACLPSCWHNHPG